MSLPVRLPSIPGPDPLTPQHSPQSQTPPEASRSHLEPKTSSNNSLPSVCNQELIDPANNATMGCLDLFLSSSSLSSPASTQPPTPVNKSTKRMDKPPTSSSAENDESSHGQDESITRKSKPSKVLRKNQNHVSNLDSLDSIKSLPPKASKVIRRTLAKKKEKTPPSPPVSTRPSRTRKAPERFTDIKEAPKPTPAPRVTASKVFDPTFITTSSTSRLVKADVFHMLLENAAWSSLSAADMTAVLQRLPPTAANINLLSKTMVDDETEVNRPKELGINYTLFRTDVAKFQQDLYHGHLARGWQQHAEQAMIDRAAGRFDQWKFEESERWWGQNMESFDESVNE
ncbi:Asx homology domain-containing protein [Dendryphion nanum]|uniref:Asx homology domain-containing protein n=1 Tax=Dendryphion nanum TaxID=256645 RepID=A0A9P9DFB6_9PLEO|nr:Asx homology domain-containing protein [Dendryphion nanum]